MKKKNQKQNYLAYNDEELVMLIAQGSMEAFNILFQKFQGLIYKRIFDFSKKYNIPEMHFDELYSVSTDALEAAIEKYVYNPYSPFKNYWWSIAEYKFLTFLRKISDSKIYYFDPEFLENEVHYLSDSVEEETPYMTVNFAKDLLKDFQIKLTRCEMQLLEFLIAGYSFKEIIDAFEWSKSKVYRVRRKLVNKLNKINNLN